MIMKPIKNINIPNKIMEQIKTNIMNKELRPGDRLPSEREIAEKTGASRASVREALRSLEMIGVIKTIWGDGSYVNDNIEDNLSESIELLFSLSGHSYEQVVQLRRAIEIETVSLAAKNADKSDILRLKELFDKIENGKNPTESAEYDRQFHYEIAKISKNIFFTNLLRGVNHIMTSFILITRENIIAGENRPMITKHHEDIISAIQENNEKMARKVMTQHIEMIEKYYKRY